jgi:hypothetical protein
MAIVTRYFSTTGAGAADGTTWANRAALFSSGNWSSVITGFNFSGSDSLECRIEGGLTYTCSQSLASGLFANVPTALNQITLAGCDSSGDELAVPDPDWVSSQPAFSTTTFPVLSSSTNIAMINLNHCNARFLRLESSGGTTNPPVSNAWRGLLSWCYLLNSAANTSAHCLNMTSRVRVANCVLVVTGSSYNANVLITNTDSMLSNCRLVGNASASSGNRRGCFASQHTVVTGCTAMDHIGDGFTVDATAVDQQAWFLNCLADTVGNGFSRVNTSGTQTFYTHFTRCIATNCTGYGFLATGSNRAHLFYCRARDASSGNAVDNSPTGTLYTTAETDANEYVDAASGDYRIKNTATIWGKGYGPGDEPPSGGGGSALHLGQLGQTGIGYF